MSINYTLALLQAIEIQDMAFERLVKGTSFVACAICMIVIGLAWGFAAVCAGMVLAIGATVWGAMIGREMIREESAETLKTLNEKL